MRIDSTGMWFISWDKPGGVICNATLQGFFWTGARTPGEPRPFTVEVGQFSIFGLLPRICICHGSHVDGLIPQRTVGAVQQVWQENTDIVRIFAVGPHDTRKEGFGVIVRLSLMNIRSSIY